MFQSGQNPLPGLKQEGSLQSSLSFLNQLFGWEGQLATVSLGCELILRLVHSMAVLCAWYSLFSGVSRLCLPASWLEHSWAAQLAVFSSPSGQMRPEDALHSGWGCDSVLYLGVGKLGFRASTDRSVLCGSSLIRMCSLLGFARGQSFWVYYLGRCELGLPRSLCWLLPAPLPSLSQSGSR